MTPAPAMRLDQAAALIRPDWLMLMAQAAYAASRQPGSSLPDWPDVEPTFKDALRREVLGAIAAGVGAGFLKIVNGASA